MSSVTPQTPFKKPRQQREVSGMDLGDSSPVTVQLGSDDLLSPRLNSYKLGPLSPYRNRDAVEVAEYLDDTAFQEGEDVQWSVELNQTRPLF